MIPGLQFDAVDALQDGPELVGARAVVPVVGSIGVQLTRDSFLAGEAAEDEAAGVRRGKGRKVVGFGQ